MSGIKSVENLTKENKLLAADLKKSNEELHKVIRRLQNNYRQKDEFISMAAHELRAPMTAIKGYISMLLSGDAGPLPEKAKGYLLDATAISERIIRLVNNMLNVSRIEEGRTTYQMKKVGMFDIVKQVYEQTKFESERKGLKYTLDTKKGLNDWVFVDPDRLYEVIDNLVSNAIKYTNDGIVIIKIFNPNKSYVKLEVKDSGPGISFSEQKRLFRKFYRVKSTVGKTIGTGLGLYISKLLIERFDGEMGVDSSSQKGATFWFKLPVENQK